MLSYEQKEASTQVEAFNKYGGGPCPETSGYTHRSGNFIRIKKTY